MLSKWTRFSVLSLLLSIASCMLKFLKLMADLFGCCAHDKVKAFTYHDVQCEDAASTTVSMSMARDGSPGSSGSHTTHSYGHSTSSSDSGSTSFATKLSLITDSDSDDTDENDDSDDEDNGDERTLMHRRRTNRRRKSGKRRSASSSLRIKRKAAFKRHKLLMIPEEAHLENGEDRIDGDDWST